MEKPKIYIGADHAGYYMKEAIKAALTEDGYLIEDLGAAELVETDDYPQYGHAVAEAVVNDPGSLGVLSCGNAEGIAIVANKTDGARAAIGYSLEAARTSRNDDNANIISVPGRNEDFAQGIEIVRTFLTTPFSNEERHVRRLKQVEEIEKHP
jgi:ribose 5-phosphate isomerase B